MRSENISLILFGTPEFAKRVFVPLFENNSHYSVLAVVTQPDKPAGRGNRLVQSPVKELAEQFSAPVLQPKRLRKESDAFLKELERYGKPDLGVVVAFGQILPKAVLEFPVRGCVNLHASLLPRWRGAAPIQRAVMAGDTKSGVCLMEMDEGLDTGPVFYREEVELKALETAGTLHDKLATLGARLLNEKLHLIASGNLSSAPQSEEGITYAEKILNDEALVDFSVSANEVSARIRGLSPYPGAYCFLHQKRLKIFLAQAVDAPQSRNALQSRPGEVIVSENDRLIIQCNPGAVELLEVQLEGKKRMTARDFLCGFPLKEDTLLTDDPKL